jgi:hypothetical protein
VGTDNTCFEVRFKLLVQIRRCSACELCDRASSAVMVKIELGHGVLSCLLCCGGLRRPALLAGNLRSTGRLRKSPTSDPKMH